MVKEDASISELVKLMKKDQKFVANTYRRSPSEVIGYGAENPTGAKPNCYQSI